MVLDIFAFFVIFAPFPQLLNIFPAFLHFCAFFPMPGYLLHAPPLSYCINTHVCVYVCSCAYGDHPSRWLTLAVLGPHLPARALRASGDGDEEQGMASLSLHTLQPAAVQVWATARTLPEMPCHPSAGERTAMRERRLVSSFAFEELF